MPEIKERMLYSRIINEAKKDDWLLYRIEDAGVNKKPFDIGGCSEDGKAVAIEVKVSDNKRVSVQPPVSLLSDHQVQWLSAFSRNGGIALLMVYYTVIDCWVLWIFTIKDGACREVFDNQNSLAGWVQKLKKYKVTDLIK